MTSFGKRLKELRKRKGLSQDVLAEKLGLKSGKQTISNWELDNTEPPLSQLRKLAAIFEITVSALMGESEEEKNQQEKPGLKCMPMEEYVVLLEKVVRCDDLQRKYDELLRNQPDRG